MLQKPATNKFKFLYVCWFSLSIYINFIHLQLGLKCRELKDIHFGQCYKISDEGMIIIAKGCLKLQRIYMQENKLVSTCSNICSFKNVHDFLLSYPVSNFSASIFCLGFNSYATSKLLLFFGVAKTSSPQFIRF